MPATHLTASMRAIRAHAKQNGSHSGPTAAGFSATDGSDFIHAPFSHLILALRLEAIAFGSIEGGGL